MSGSDTHDHIAAQDAGSVSSKRGTALSTKLTSVLSSSYADSEIREALRLFDIRHSTNDHEYDIDLRYEAQKEVIDSNARIIDDFAKVAKQLHRVGTLIDNLNTTCASIRQHVLAAKQETAPMLDEATTLLAQKEETENKQKILASFTKHFLISDEDLGTLTNTAEPVDARFFDVLARAKQIHGDCEILLGYENQRMGLELMEQTVRNLNAGYKKLFNWTLREFKGLDLEDPQISGSIRRSLRALSDRPALFQNCLDSFAEARQSTVSEGFSKALTETTLGAARAIDFSTHDPLRYMGDMLAWVHSATVSEMEAMEGLFISDADEIGKGLHSGRAADPFASNADEDEIAFDGRAALNSLISRNMASVASTLAQRITVTVRSLNDAVDIYKAYNLLSFYYDMFKKVIRPSATSKDQTKELRENSLLSTLTDLQTTTFKHFETTVLDSLHSSLDTTLNADLSPPSALLETLVQFSKIVQTRGPNLEAPEFAKLYAALVKPVLETCKSLSRDLNVEEGRPQNFSSGAPGLIYKLNYTSLVRDTLDKLLRGSQKLEVAKDPLNAAVGEVATLRESLTDLLKDRFEEVSGVDELNEALANMPDTLSFTKRKIHLLDRSDDDALDESEMRLERLAVQLDTFLASALMDAQDELNTLLDRELAAGVLTTAVKSFCGAFQDVVQALEEIDEGVEREALAKKMGKNSQDATEEEIDDEEVPNVRDVYPRTLEDVQALLS